MDIQDFTSDTWDLGRYPNISWHEVSCSKTDLCRVDVDFLDFVQQMRTDLGFPLNFSSIYRHPTHPIEARKVADGRLPGSHAMGCAVDIKCSGMIARQILCWCTLYYDTFILSGIGVSQKGAGRFVHLDAMNEDQCNSLGIGDNWATRLWTY